VTKQLSVLLLCIRDVTPAMSCCPVLATGMSLFCTGWTFIWLLLLPFGIIPDSTPNSSEATWWALLPISVMTAMMLGLEDLATQLEDPFKFIPYGEAADCLAGCAPRRGRCFVTQRVTAKQKGGQLRSRTAPYS
jgi:predicted membrane chloride channel (bestrophin family)